MKRGKFSLSHYKLLSCDMGELVPIGVTEVLPGDTVQHNCSAFLRAAPLLSPVMHPVEVRIHHWFVPYRLVWDDFEDFITGGPDGEDASVYPTIDMPASTGAAVGSLADYLGVPTGVADLEVSALPFRAYALIFNEWYRDQDLVSELALSTASGADATTSTALQNCAWEKDYFTSSRPWEQKGPSITIPLGDSAPVSYVPGNSAAPILRKTSDGSVYTVNDNLQNAATTGALRGNALGAGNPLFIDPNGTLEADLSSVSGISVNELREALALQRYEENRARFGSRYIEYLRYLGVRSSDARLQRPEYLGGGRQFIQFSEVLQTGVTTDGDDLGVGNLRGHGVAAMRSNRYRRFFEEHGVVVTLMSVRPRTVYMQGLPRMWNRRVKEDFWQQELQHIGQQGVLNKEVYAAHSSPDGVFGYQDRYDEYRRHWSQVSGEFRTSELNYWHLARDFAGDPALNETFVECVPTERVFAAPDEDVLYVMAKHHMIARRLVAQVGRSFIY